MKTKIDFKSVILGAVLGVISVVSVGAVTDQPFLGAFAPVRFRILDVSRHGEPINGKQTTVLRVAPHYGKIDTKSHDFRSKHETQNLTLVTAIDTGYEIRTNDIIGFQVTEHIKIGR